MKLLTVRASQKFVRRSRRNTAVFAIPSCLRMVSMELS